MTESVASRCNGFLSFRMLVYLHSENKIPRWCEVNIFQFLKPPYLQ